MMRHSVPHLRSIIESKLFGKQLWPLTTRKALLVPFGHLLFTVFFVEYYLLALTMIQAPLEIIHKFFWF